MKKNMIAAAFIILMTIFFGVSSHAAIRQCDFSDPKDHTVDGWDLSQFVALYAAHDSLADVNGDGLVDSADVAHFAGFFGISHAPNILLIIADDVGIDVATNMYTGLIEDLEDIYGVGSGVKGRPASLPVLKDRLADQGMVFSNVWAQPFCSPSRATIITGLFEDKTQVKMPDNPLLSYHTTFVQLLKQSGYSTAMIGKWHLAGSSPSWSGVRPRQAGFDLFRGNFMAYIPDYWSYDVHIQDDDTTGTDYRTESAPTKSLPGIAATTYAPVVKGSDAIEWIQARHVENPEKPWFVWLAFNTSHVTTQSVPMVVPDFDTLDDASRSEMSGCGGTFGSNTVGDCAGPELMRAMANSMDTVIGKVLDVVDSLGSNTYVIFVGDNGTPMYGTTYGNQIDNMYITKAGRGKGTVFESGCRVPMAIRGPNIAAGTQINESNHIADLYNTILTLSGLTPLEKNYNNTGAEVDSDSKTLTPILFGSATTPRRDPEEGYLLTETGGFFGGNKVGARNATYKVLCTTNTSTSNCSFYNLLLDPLEEDPRTDKPSSCENYYNDTWTTADPQWHYCYLIEMINNYSIFP